MFKFTTFNFLASSKQNVTVLFTFPVRPLTTPPMSIYLGESLKAEIAASVPPERGIIISATGR